MLADVNYISNGFWLIALLINWQSIVLLTKLLTHMSVHSLHSGFNPPRYFGYVGFKVASGGLMSFPYTLIHIID